jgi:transcription initiation factor IIE alpha subunit
MSDSSYTPLPPVPEEYRVLSMMHNIGAITPERSLTSDELATWTGIEVGTVKDCLQRLSELGYVEHLTVNGVEKYHVTKVGIMKVLTLYS